MDLALVGCAHIHTPGFLKRLKERAGARVKWVWDHDAARAQKNAAECGGRVAADLADIWRDAEVPAIVICAGCAARV
jgi:predicted dehydrogenase